jgi:hypothetical protein
MIEPHQTVGASKTCRGAPAFSPTESMAILYRLRGMMCCLREITTDIFLAQVRSPEPAMETSGPAERRRSCERGTLAVSEPAAGLLMLQLCRALNDPTETPAENTGL